MNWTLREATNEASEKVFLGIELIEPPELIAPEHSHRVVQGMRIRSLHFRVEFVNFTAECHEFFSDIQHDGDVVVLTDDSMKSCETMSCHISTFLQLCKLIKILNLFSHWDTLEYRIHELGFR